MTTKTNELDDSDAGARASRGLRVALVLAALALAAGCGVLWMRYGAQVFIDAALFAWRSCF